MPIRTEYPADVDWNKVTFDWQHHNRGWLWRLNEFGKGIPDDLLIALWAMVIFLAGVTLGVLGQ